MAESSHPEQRLAAPLTPSSPRVSVVIPTYNYGRYLPRAIEGALEQGQDVAGGVEVIVVDDGSTDDTEEVMRRFEGRVAYVRQRNQREAAARNNGAARANGEYLAFLDPDDYWLPGKLAADVRRFEGADRPALVYSSAINVNAVGEPIGARGLPTPQGDLFNLLARENFIPMSSVATRADAFAACGGFNTDPDLSGTADWELWMRMAARWSIGYSAQRRTCIRVHASNMTSDPRWMGRSMLAAIRHLENDPAASRRLGTGNGVVRLRAHMYTTVALNAYTHGAHRRQTLPWLARALSTWPPVVRDPRYSAALLRVLLGRQAARALRRSTLRP